MLSNYLVIFFTFFSPSDVLKHFRMSKFVVIVENQFIEVEATIQQLSSKDKQAEFNTGKIELLGQSVFDWIINVSFS